MDKNGFYIIGSKWDLCFAERLQITFVVKLKP